MVDVRITLSGLWIAVMLTFLLGDVLRSFAGDITPGEIAGLPYPGAYDNFLIAVSLVFCALIVWYAWTWLAPAKRQAGVLA